MQPIPPGGGRIDPPSTRASAPTREQLAKADAERRLAEDRDRKKQEAETLIAGEQLASQLLYPQPGQTPQIPPSTPTNVAHAAAADIADRIAKVAEHPYGAASTAATPEHAEYLAQLEAVAAVLANYLAHPQPVASGGCWSALVVVAMIIAAIRSSFAL